MLDHAGKLIQERMEGHQTKRELLYVVVISVLLSFEVVMGEVSLPFSCYGPQSETFSVRALEQ